jgi:PAS domain S-box-containing protein
VAHIAPKGARVDCPDLRTLLEQPSHSFLRAVLEAVPCGASIGLDSKIVYSNETCARMWGYPQASDMKGVPFFSLIAPQWHDLVFMLWSARREHTDPWTYELEGQRVDGTVFPYRIVSVSRDTVMGKATFAFFTEIDSCIGPEEQTELMRRMLEDAQPEA